MKIKEIYTKIHTKPKRRFLTPKMQNDLKTVLTKMNELTEYKSTGNTFSTKIVKILEAGKNSKLMDDRMFARKVPAEKQMEHTTILSLGKTKLLVYNKTGRIIRFKKPFFKPWKRVMKQTENFLRILAENFDNSQIVRQKTIQLSGFTQKGAELLQKLAKSGN